jgi:hypothetical protein
MTKSAPIHAPRGRTRIRRRAPGAPATRGGQRVEPTRARNLSRRAPEMTARTRRSDAAPRGARGGGRQTAARRGERSPCLIIKIKNEVYKYTVERGFLMFFPHFYIGYYIQDYMYK